MTTGAGVHAMRIATYNTNDSSIVLSVVSLDGLNESHRGEKERDPREQSKADGQGAS